MHVTGFPALLLGLAVAAGITTPDRERVAREIETMLIAPCCFTQQVSVHGSPAADEVRKDIRRRLEAGETRDQILEAYVAQYGNRILAEPPAAGAGRVLYVLSVLGFVAGAAVLVVALRRVTRRRSATLESHPLPVGAPDSRYAQTLDDQLRDLD